MCVVQFTDHRCRHMCTMHIWSAIADSTCTTGAGRELLTRHSWLRCRQCDPTLSKPQFTSSHIKVKFKIIPTLGTRVLQKPTITQPFMKFSVYCRTQRLSMTCLVSGVPRGGVWGVQTPHPPKFWRYLWSPRSHKQEEPASRFPFAVHCILIRL